MSIAAKGDVSEEKQALSLVGQRRLFLSLLEIVRITFNVDTQGMKY